MVLKYTLRGRTIAEVLDLSVEAAADLFTDHRRTPSGI
jgi:excinuclease UvrABC ATPase subunit